MGIIVSYEHASGLSFDDCFFLGLRYDEEHGFQPEESECWIMSVRPARSGPHPYELRYQGGTISWYTGLWRSPAGKLYVSDTSGQLHSHPDLWAPDARNLWQENQLGVGLEGIWGIDDRCVFTWGGTPKHGFKMFRFDGSDWSEMPHPGIDLRSLHGLAPDLLYAVGVGGRIARWDGRSWTEVSSPVAENLRSVFVASPDEIYAVGAAGAVLEGSAHGWGVIATSPMGQVGMPLYAVAKWKGELWIGGGPQGLYRRVGTTDQLDNIKPNVKAVSLDARGDLVIGTPDYVAGTSDGKGFMAVGMSFLQDDRSGKKLGDLQ